MANIIIKAGRKARNGITVFRNQAIKRCRFSNAASSYVSASD